MENGLIRVSSDMLNAVCKGQGPIYNSFSGFFNRDIYSIFGLASKIEYFRPVVKLKTVVQERAVYSKRCGKG